MTEASTIAVNNLPADKQRRTTNTSSERIIIADTQVGKGVFAARDISSGVEIGRVTGTVIDDPNYSSNYCIDLGGPLSLEPGEPFRFLNHSCEPNCELVYYEADPAGGWPLPTIFVETIARVHRGDQLTIDYGWPADNAIECLCGAATCRGWVVDPAELDAVNQAET